MVSPTVLPGVAFASNARRSTLLLHWRAQDLSLKTVDGGVTGTFTRASVGGLTEGRGHTTDSADTDVRLVGPTADNQPRFGLSTAGVPHLLLEDTRKNWMPIENPTTGWQTSTAFSTGSETTVGPDGTLISLLTDNSTAATEQMIQDVEVNSTVAIVTWYTKWNGSTFGAVHRMNLTGAADRGQVVWNFGSTGAMTITSTGSGNVISAPSHIGNNWWKTSLEAPSVVVANDNQVEITPAITAVGTTGGDMFIAHVNVESVASTGLSASSHIPTAGAAITRATETISWAYPPVPQAMTVYLKVANWRRGLASATLLHVGSATAATDPRLVLNVTSTGTITATYDDGTTVATTGAIAKPSAGVGLEFLITLTGLGVVDLAVSTDGGAQTDVASAAGGVLSTAWAGQLVYLNSAGTSTKADGEYETLQIAAGVQTMQHMREAF